eukprot:TRINITY_DN31603_c0_g4_i1.p1 TRINITY_DN31603_c0_g4~~TRINITY_DN31603_c0_g4_i1.p1  ORF type:complete len:261 (+),score=6.96 TRINITY_DN31603_c0_g4_i1:56-784(+)
MASVWSSVPAMQNMWLGIDCNPSRQVRVALTRLRARHTNVESMPRLPQSFDYVSMPLSPRFLTQRCSAYVGCVPIRRTANGSSYSMRILHNFDWTSAPAFGVCAESPALLRKRQRCARGRAKALLWNRVRRAFVRRDGFFWDDSHDIRGMALDLRLDRAAVLHLMRDGRGDAHLPLPNLISGDVVTVSVANELKAGTQVCVFEYVINGIVLGKFGCGFKPGEDVYAMIGTDRKADLLALVYV